MQDSCHRTQDARRKDNTASVEDKFINPWRTTLRPWRTKTVPWRTTLRPWRTNTVPWRTTLRPWRTKTVPWRTTLRTGLSGPTGRGSGPGTGSLGKNRYDIMTEGFQKTVPLRLLLHLSLLLLHLPEFLGLGCQALFALHDLAVENDVLLQYFPHQPLPERRERRVHRGVWGKGVFCLMRNAEGDVDEVRSTG